MTPHVRVHTADFCVGSEMAALRESAPQAGALASFVGLVRAEDGAVDALELEHHPQMAQRSLERIASDAAERFGLDAVRLIHRVGRLAVGEQIVGVWVASRHRSASFEGCEFIMDYLKTQAPFWKKQRGSAGSSWVAAKASDDLAAGRWETA